MSSRQEENELQPIVKIEEWLFLILVGLIPIVNIVAFIYFSFNRKMNANKRNFARAVLIYLIIILLLAFLTTILL